MMRIRPCDLVWKIVPFILAIALPCQAAQFTAELTITSPQGNFVYNLCVKDDLMRLEKTAGPMTVPPFPINQSIAFIRKWPICPISMLRGKFYPRDINYMPAVKFSVRLDLEQI